MDLGTQILILSAILLGIIRLGAWMWEKLREWEWYE